MDTLLENINMTFVLAADYNIGILVGKREEKVKFPDNQRS
jgi:hypothetical protein